MANQQNVSLIEHPIIARDLTVLRDESANIVEFRSALDRIALILAYHALKEIPLKSRQVDTPIETTEGFDIDSDVVVVPILRAGLGLVNGILEFIPSAKVGHLGMYRDETTHKPVDYYSKLPDDIANAFVILADPMLATGGSAHDALTLLKKEGAQQIHFISLISAPEGLAHIQKEHPDVHVVTAAIDKRLNNEAFIVPGLGDAGDRYFGTK